MTEKMKTWIRGFVGGVAACVVVGGIGYFICFGSFPLIGDQTLSLSDLAKASKIAKLVDTYYLDYKDEDEKSQYTMGGWHVQRNRGKPAGSIFRILFRRGL